MSTYIAAAILATGCIGLAFLVEKVVGNCNNVDINLGALVKEAQAVEELRTVADGVTGLLVGNLVAAVNALVVATRPLSLRDGEGVKRCAVGRLRVGDDRSGEEGDDGKGIHFEGWMKV
ncbi:hypothetical protein HG530_014757 [Fusarium avenaceum]|nr:hypothetical protein HG530_014757 [Fusarium avenaceum]